MKLQVALSTLVVFVNLLASTVSAQTNTDTKENSAKSLVGIWQSNTELTLQSLNQIEGLSEDSLKYLKQNVLGRLKVEFTGTQTRSYFGKANKKEELSNFSAYTISEQTDEFVKISYTDPLSEKVTNSTLYWELDCYYELVSKWQYKEYFCPLVEKKKFIAIPNSSLSQ